MFSVSKAERVLVMNARAAGANGLALDLERIERSAQALGEQLPLFPKPQHTLADAGRRREVAAQVRGALARSRQTQPQQLGQCSARLLGLGDGVRLIAMCASELETARAKLCLFAQAQQPALEGGSQWILVAQFTQPMQRLFVPQKSGQRVVRRFAGFLAALELTRRFAQGAVERKRLEFWHGRRECTRASVASSPGLMSLARSTRTSAAKCC